jgi:hypothetical protein
MFAIAQHLRHIPVTRYRHRHQPTGSPLAERILLLYLPDSRLQDCELHPFFRITDCNASLSKRDSTRGCPGVTGTSSMPLHKRKKGALFTTRAGRLLDSRNVLDVLQRAGRQGGYHAFRRFRFAVLRKAGVPDDLIKLWLGHSQNLIDLYAAQLRYDDTYRRGWCDRAGLGFELGELGYKSEAPIRPALVA